MRILEMAGRAATAASLALAADEIGDARRGEQIFENLRCIQCHSINGRGGTAAPDLGKHIAREFTPAAMAALMWDHGPRMLELMSQRKIAWPRFTAREMSNLIAYLNSLAISPFH